MDYHFQTHFVGGVYFVVVVVVPGVYTGRLVLGQHVQVVPYFGPGGVLFTVYGWL